MMCSKMPVVHDYPPGSTTLADNKTYVAALADIKTDIAALADIKTDIGDLKAHVMILSLKIDAVESLLTDLTDQGSVRDLMCGLSADSRTADQPINPVCRQFVDVVDYDAYQEPVHELKDILRRGKPVKGKPRWK